MRTSRTIGYVFDEVIEALLQISDRVEPAELGAVYARLDGLELLHGSEAKVAAALLDAVPDWLNARVGVGDSKFASYIAALSADAGRVAACPTDEAGFLAPMSIELLPLSDDLKNSLHNFGAHSMGQVAALPCAMLTDRFGRKGSLAWELCSSIDRRHVVPIKPAVYIVERASLPFASTSMELLLTTVDILLQRAYSRPQLRRRPVGSVALASTSLDAKPWTRVVRFKTAAGNWRRASEAVRADVEAHPPQYPLEDLTLALNDLTGESGRQLGLLEQARDRRRDRLVEADEKLRARMNGLQALHKVVEVAPWHPAPEMRALKVPVDAFVIDAFTPLHSPLPAAVQESEAHRPLAIRLKRGWHRIDGIDDLWRFDLWWLPTPVTRCYFSITDAGGWLKNANRTCR